MKNTKLKIETGSEKLTAEEISKNKDFSKVYKTYTTTTTNTHTVKVPKKFGGMTSVVVVTTTVVVTTIGAWKYWSSKKTTEGPKVTASSSTNSSNKTASTSATVAKKPYVNPPLKGVDVPFKTYTVDADKGAVLKYGKSTITIPSSAFVDEKGNSIKGQVDIKYREFHNAIEFFASGIPMTYDSAGQQYTFQSAGMLDVKGYQGGKQVYVRTGKEIQVAMETTQKRISYNVYELDTNKQNWNYLSKSKSVQLPAKADTTKEVNPVVVADQQQATQLQNTVATAKQEETKLEQTKPVAPEKYSTGKYTFDIDADPKDYPELAGYKKVLWAPDASDKNYKPSYANVVWEDASLKKSDNSNNYTFTVKKGNETHSFLVHPVFEGQDYETAMKDFDKKYAVYQAAYDKRKAEEKKAQEQYEAAMAKIKKDQEDEENRQLAYNTQYAVTNYFVINNFGIYNTDFPGALPRGADLTPQYTDNLSEDLNYNEFYLVEKDLNAVYTYHPGHNCKFNPNRENFAWMVTPANKIAIYSIDDFKNITQRHGDFTFAMKVDERPVKNIDDLKAIFKQYM